MAFDNGRFEIYFRGMLGQGKTVALDKVKGFLEPEGYTVTKALDDTRPRGEYHLLKVSWSK